MGNCKDCKHWQAPSEYQSHPLQRYDEDYELIELGDTHQHRVCGLIVLADSKQRDSPPLAFTMDASDYCAVLWTAPDFGCALFEAKACSP